MAVVVGMKNPNDHAEPTKKSNAKNKIILLTSYVSNTLEVHIIFANFRIVCIKTFGKSLQLFPNTYWKLLIC